MRWRHWYEAARLAGCPPAAARPAMMELLTEWVGPCPHCGQSNSFEIDRTAGRRQAWIEDCWVCCRPIQVAVGFDAHGGLDVVLAPAQ